MDEVQNLYTINDELDWYHEARGYYACVNLAYDLRNNQKVAFKVIRKEFLNAYDSTGKYNGEWEAFAIEVRALHKFHDHDFSVDFVDCGYVEIGLNDDMPKSNNHIISLGNDEIAVQRFLETMAENRKKNMRPFIVTEYVDQKYGTVFVVDPENESIYRRYPVKDVLNAISQFIDLMIYLQENDYVYLDHKLAHTYWLLETSQLKVIDWNGGFFLSDLMPAERDTKLYQDNRHLIGMVMYGLLTGKAVPSYGKLAEMGRNMGSLLIPEDCPGHALIQEFINETVKNKYKTAHELRSRFDLIMLEYGIEVHGQQPTPENKRARERVDLLMQEASEVYKRIEQLADLLNQKNTLEGLPDHFLEEVRSLGGVFRGLKEAQSIVLK